MNDETTVRTIAETIRRYLEKREDTSIPIEVIDESIRHDRNWWYVPVRAREELRTYRLYDDLTEIEKEIREKERLDVLLLPSA
jgi:hypothetical protein